MFERIKNFFSVEKAEKEKRAGVSGAAVYGGYIQTNETDSRVIGQERHRTAADILANVSVVAASVRFFLNLLAKPSWSVEPVDDTPEAAQAAEFVESVIDGMQTSWTRIIRRSGLYRFHGFGIQEWVSFKRFDGKIGYVNVEPRPVHTIERWDVDKITGKLRGVWQRAPQTGNELYLPRNALIYYVDDTLTDSPEGMGWFRHLVEPAQRLKRLLELEKIAYERDLKGIPVGRAPIAAINTAVRNGELSAAQARDLVAGITNFVQLEVVKSNTGLVLDSETFRNQAADGPQYTGVPKWDIQLLTSSAGNMAQLLETVRRLNMEMALIIGTENILTGTGDVGSLALSKDKSNNLYLQVSSTLEEMKEINTRDFIGPLWRMNGFDDRLKPRFKTEDISFKDVEVIAATLREMATAGAILSPEDPAIDDVRDLLGVSRDGG